MPKLQRHHLQFPRKAYKTPLERAFRQLGCNIELLEPEVHLAIHQTLYETPGGVPSETVMAEQLAYCRSQGCKGSVCRIRGGRDE